MAPKPFSSPEHEAFGCEDPSVTDNVSSDTLNDTTLLNLSSGAKITIGQAIALFGDYYAGEEPICLGENQEQREERFLNAYHALDSADPAEVYGLTEMFKSQRAEIDLGLKEGKKEEDELNASASGDTKKAMACTHGKYLKLALKNLDHFGDDALIAFQTGYSLAIKAAFEAHQQSEVQDRKTHWNIAMQLAACACHFLTDHFAAGHIRTERAALQKKFGDEVGSLLSLFQHNEDGDHGLIVSNQLKESWKAYGDGHAFEKYSKDNFDRTKHAVLTVFAELYRVFQTGELLELNQSTVFQLIPTADKENNFSALFVVGEDNEIFCRSEIDNIHCTTYEELTLPKVTEILAHHAESSAETYAETNIDKTLESLRDKLHKENEKAENYFDPSDSGSSPSTSVTTVSMFNRHKVSPQSKKNATHNQKVEQEKIPEHKSKGCCVIF